jgi:aminoglycoside phosphotransferase (APT) family kinase protein
MLELLSVDPGRTNELLTRFGAIQAALHEVKVPSESTGGSLREVTSPVDELAGDDRVETNHGRELAWLARQPTATAGDAVLCHGAFQPGLVTGDPALGEPLVVRNWGEAVLAEPEYDIAYSTLAFWAAPYYTGTRSERAGMKMIRDMLTNVYRGGYEHERPFDAGRVRVWQVFHGLRAAVDPGAPAELRPAVTKLLKKLTS